MIDPNCLHFLPLGGSGEIGMNMNLYCYKNKWLMVDCGITFENDLGIEIEMPDPKFILEQKNDLVGLVLTHAHEDHLGAVPYLWPQLNCPIYATQFTLGLLKTKFQEKGIDSRDLLREIPVGGSFKLDPFEIEFIALTHSIPEPSALAIKTDKSSVLHTGDWKLDPKPLVGEGFDIERLKELGNEGISALVCDSTNVFVEGETGSESEVREHLTELVSHQKDRVVIACFASNVARLETTAHVAKANGRRPVLLGRSLERVDRIARDCGYFQDLPPFLSPEEGAALPKNKVLYIATGSQGEERAALFRLAHNLHSQAKLSKGDSVIFSSRMIPGNEQGIHALQQQLMKNSIAVITSENAFIHVSGHPGREDLKSMYDWIKPNLLIPVHGEMRHMDEQADLGISVGIPHAVVPKNGTVINIDAEKPSVIDTVYAGRLAIDGKVIVERDSAYLFERHSLMHTGTVLITIVIDSKAMLIVEPQITSLGVIEVEVKQEINASISKEIEKFLNGMSLEARSNNNSVRDMLQKRVRGHLNSLRGKKPLVAVHVVRIKSKS